MRKNKGFTLVEILVCVAIFIILLGMLVAALNHAGENIRDSQRREQMVVPPPVRMEPPPLKAEAESEPVAVGTEVTITIQGDRFVVTYYGPKEAKIRPAD